MGGGNYSKFMKDLLYKVALTKNTIGRGSGQRRNLVSYCGGAKRGFLWHAKRTCLKYRALVVQTATSVCQPKRFLEEAEKEVQYLEKENITPLFYLDKNYPQRLTHYPDAPVYAFL